jgi:hypothetical protein
MNAAIPAPFSLEAQVALIVTMPPACEVQCVQPAYHGEIERDPETGRPDQSPKRQQRAPFLQRAFPAPDARWISLGLTIPAQDRRQPSRNFPRPSARKLRRRARAQSDG